MRRDDGKTFDLDSVFVSCRWAKISSYSEPIVRHKKQQSTIARIGADLRMEHPESKP